MKRFLPILFVIALGAVLLYGMRGNPSLLGGGIRLPAIVQQIRYSTFSDPYADRNGDGMGDYAGPVTCGGGVQGTPVNNCDNWLPGEEPGHDFVITSQEGHLYP